MLANSGQSSWGVAMRLVVPCDLKEVRPAAKAVVAFLQEEGLHPEEMTACELALTEACNNAVEHASPPRRGDPIEVRLFCNASGVEFQITDHTPGFDWPDTVTLPESGSERGRGLFIIHSLMDQVSYLRGRNENLLVLHKRRCFQAHRLSTTLSASGKDARLKLAECRENMSHMAKELCFRSETLAAIFRCTAELGRTHNLEGFSRGLLHDLVIITAADWFVLRLVASHSQQLLTFATSELESSLAPPALPGAGQPISFKEVQAAVTGEDVWFDPHRPLPSDDPLQRLKPNSSGLIHPIFFGGTLIGTLAIGRQNSGCPFTLEQAEVIHTFTEFLAIQVVNNRSQEEHVQLRLVSHELEIARNIQRALLPKSLPQLRGFGLAAFSESAGRVGGDFYDVLPISDHSVWLLVADVMGKGVPAAMFAAILRSSVEAILPWTQRPSDLLARINRLLFEDLSQVDMFITAQLALLDLKERHLIAASAGHCPILLAVPGADEVQSIAPKGMPLGILPDSNFSDVTVNLGPGCRVLFYTDGLTGAEDAGGETLGQNRLMSWLKQTAGRPATAQSLREELVAQLARGLAAGSPPDDQTFLLLAEEDRS